MPILLRISPYFIGLCLIIIPALAAEPNGYEQTNFVANKAEYHPVFATEPNYVNAWGIAIRPAGAGGHFWITAKDVSYEYVGDVRNSQDEKLKKLGYDEKLKTVKLPIGGDDKFATAVVFLDSKSAFTITQNVDGAEPITAPSKFLFSSDGGIISAWTERKKPDGSFDRPTVAIPVINRSKEGSQFFGLAVNQAYDRIYLADFGAEPSVRVYDGNFKPLDITFDTPFDANKNGKVDPGEYAPFNIQGMKTPSGAYHIFVTYALTQLCNKEGLEKGDCKEGQLLPGEEETSAPGHGRLAEFDENGKLVAIWNDDNKLSAPWGMAFAPTGFGALSGKLLVGNFGNGSIQAFDPATHTIVDSARDAKGNTIKIEKIWGLLFGNGASLGDADTLYFTAGPNDEKDGIFGKLTLATPQ